MISFYLFFFLLGLIIGSFLNVVIFRYNTGRTLSGRSGCLSCGKKLRWFELVPLLSFLFQRGKCRACRSRLSWQYPLVELSTGLLFVLIFWRVGWSVKELFFYLLTACLLQIILVYDFKHKIIADFFVYSFILLGFLWRFDLVGGLVTALPLFLLWAGSRGKWMGFGDVKLALGIGLFLGLAGGLSALVLAFIIGAVVGLLLLAKSYTMKSEIPFAPFLILGFWLVFLFSLNVFAFF